MGNFREFLQVQLNKNEYLCIEGDQLEYTFCVIEGSLEITSTANNGEILLVGTSGPGDLVGETEMLLEQECLCNVKALTKTTLLGIKNSDYLKAMQESWQFTKHVLRVFAERAARFHVNSTYNSLYDTRPRLCRYILTKAKNDIFQGTLEKTSSALAISVRQLQRVINDLIDEGILTKRKIGRANVYYIEDRKALENITEDP